MKITRGPQAKPFRVLIYGTEGVGKSTFAADAPSPLFLASEDGVNHLDVARIDSVSTWTDVLAALGELGKDCQGFETIVIDTLDWIEPMIWAHICKKHNQDNIESFGYGKGYPVALQEWRVFIVRLDALHAKGMNVVMIAHAAIRSFANPEGENFDRYELKLHKHAAGLCKEWCDDVLFASFEEFAIKKDAKVKGVSDGRRIMRTERRAAFDAKSRSGLPFQLPLSWDSYLSERKDPDTLEAIRAMAAGTPIESQVEELLARADTPAKLAKLGNWVRAKC